MLSKLVEIDAEIMANSVEVSVGNPVIAALVVPVARLDTEEYAEHNDREIDRHCRPVLLPQMTCQPPARHGSPLL